MIEVHHVYPLMVGYDRYSAQYLVQDLEAYGFRTDSVYQGENLWSVLQEMEGLIEDGKIHIGDNDLLKMHLLNSAIKMSNERGRGRLVKLTSSLHIDGAAALADAFTVRAKYAQEMSEQLKNEG
jgi:phage terminase large subunit-like protein